MKKLYILLVALFAFTISNAQIDFLEHEVTGSTGGIGEVNFSDIDGDGDMDLITSENLANFDNIYWIENLDGVGTFGTQNIINDDARDSRSLISADLDGDGDMDIIAISMQFVKHLFWQKNSNGEGLFESKIIIDDDFEFPREVYPSDIDGDGDIDLILVCGRIAPPGVVQNLIWYENNGLGDFTKHIISETEDLTTVTICDIDGDNDLDIVGGDYYNGNAYWYENLDGQGTFGTSNVFSSINYITSVDYADFDNDNDIDIIISSDNDYNILWYENIDGLGTFVPNIVVGFSENSSYKVLAADINGDGNIDIVSQSNETDDILWYENVNGLGDFSAAQLIQNELFNIRDIEAVDINADGKIDIIATSSPGAIDVAWYENVGLVSNKIIGTITVDSDVNGCDALDLEVPNMMVLADNGSETIATFSLSSGYYQLYPNEGFYNVSLNSPLLDYYTSNPTSHDFDFVGIGTTEIGDFCLETIFGINDLNVAIYPLMDARPGFQVSYLLVFQNVGPTILSGSVNFEFDEEKLDFISSTETVSTQTSNSLTFNYDALNPFETRGITIVFNVFPPPEVNIDDILTFTSTVTPIAGDNTEEDNTFSLDQVVVGSYDPNDIQVLEGEEIFAEEIDDYLHYIIRFQNTGNYYATFVRISNELDTNLEWNTFQLESSSHSNRVEIINGNLVTFFFDAIYLPSSDMDEQNSRGFVSYKIKPKSTVDIGDSMSNNANIYFDYNPPIVTNIVTTTVVEDLSINDNKINKITIYPNPTKSIINIDANGSIIEEIAIINLQGIVLKNIPHKNKIDVSELATGLYFIRLSVNGKTITKKFIKE